MKTVLSALLKRYPNLYLFAMLFRPRLEAVRGDVQSVHDRWVLPNNHDRVAIDLGCGALPSNRFKAGNHYGIDLYEDKISNVLKCRLGFQKLPFDDNSVDYLTAYDLLEHIPRYGDLPDQGNAPFIYFMNECHRILKKGGVFLSVTPIYPYLGAFQDPTHNNIMTFDTLRLYFSDEKLEVAKHYGITTDFGILYQGMLGQHLVAVLGKK
jgi:SAM-dependent methyltransferase